MRRTRLLSVISVMFLLASVATGDLLPRGSAITAGIAGKIDEDVFNFIADEFEEYIAYNFGRHIRDQMPIKIYDTGCMWGYTAFMGGISAMSMDWPRISVDARDGLLRFELDIHNLNMDFRLWGEYGLCISHFDCYSHVFIERIYGSAECCFIPAGNGIKTVMSSADINVVGYEYSAGFWCWIIEIIADSLERTIVEAAEAFLESYLLYDLPQIIDPALSTLAIEDVIDIFDDEIYYRIRPSDIPIVESGVSFEMATVVTAIPDEICIPYEEGSLYTPSEPPVYGPEVPGMPGHGYDLAVSISDDMFNQAFFTIFDTGVFCMRLDSKSVERYGFPFDLTTTDLKLFFPELYDVAPDARFSLMLNPKDAPFVEIGMGGGILEGQLELFFPHCLLDGYVEIFGRNVRVFSCNASIRAEILAHITNRNTLRLLFSSPPKVRAELLWEGFVDLNDATFEVFAPFMVEYLLPVLALLLPEFRLPSIEGVMLLPITIIPDGPGEDYLSMYCYLGTDGNR